jgi:hypothetical protein
MPGDNQFDRPDNFFGELKTEQCECGHRVNVTDSREHTCSLDCDCSRCREIINRQLRVMEED